MRRGLKSVLVDARIEHIAAIRRFPDEEGTEIGQSMPRVRHGTSMSIRRFPDEEGTEIRISIRRARGEWIDQKIPR